MAMTQVQEGDLLDIKNKFMLPRLPRIKTSNNRRNKSRWCEYHKECGHTTKDCQELNISLHQLVDEGRLNPYLKHLAVERRMDSLG